MICPGCHRLQGHNDNCTFFCYKKGCGSKVTTKVVLGDATFYSCVEHLNLYLISDFFDEGQK